MKRSELRRKSPLRTKKPMKRGASPTTKTQLKRTTMLRKTRLKAKPPKQRTAEQGGDAIYLRFIRGLPCVVYGTPPPSHAHHEVGAGKGGRGKSQKAPDRRTIPLSPRAHREFHDGLGFCKGWSKEKRRDWQDQEISRLQIMFATWDEFGVLEEPARVAI